MIALYKGTSWLSKWIEARTWSKYSHASYIMRDGTEIEAWGRHGICHNRIFGGFHETGSEVDCYDFDKPLTDKEHDSIESFLLAQVGKKYDYIGLFRFLPIVRWFVNSNDNTEKWFCSELVSEACKQAGRELLRKPCYMIEPGEIAASEQVSFKCTRIVGKDGGLNSTLPMPLLSI